ncbi:hypothetical protein [Cyanothece sp. BG0011]|uniref:hypothetical protein n=1 Tax=Cyanothece sp. BG0011 TaxID=2082950 RepID=UPI000D1DD674|nr:hypothetical protein [Cyanothece sp. BG0011]
MTYPKPSNSSFRYLIAGLKPLASVKVWGSVAIMALVALVLWQYSRHPEWLGSGMPNSQIEGEFEGEVGNNVDIGVTVQDLQENRLNSEGFPPQPSQLPIDAAEQPFNPSPEQQPILGNTPNNSVLPPSADGNNSDLNQPNPPIEFQPLMPNVKNLGSLFPPLTPSKDAAKPIQLPDSALDRSQTPQENPLKDAINDVFSQESAVITPSPQENKQPSSSRTRPTRANYPTSATPSRSNMTPNQPYNNPYTYSSPQPYNQPYGSGRGPDPIPTAPSSSQFPNAYGNGNFNVNNSGATNQTPPQPTYGIQAPQVNEYGY